MPMSRLVTTLTTRTDHYETQCAGWAALRVAQNLLTLSGKAKYGNWIERLAYNSVNATIPMSPKAHVVYYSNYNMNGAIKLNRPIEATCCAGTRPLTVVQYGINIYFHDNNNIYVNLFTPSKVIWESRSGTVMLTQNTDFPYSDKNEFTVSVDNPRQFGIGIRVPGWLATPAMTARVNGRNVEGRVEKGWFVIDRKWKDKDKLIVTMPMDFWLSILDKSQGRPTAVMYGPLVMAFTTPDSTLIKSIDRQCWETEGSIQSNPEMEKYAKSDKLWWTYEGLIETNPDKELLDVIILKDIKNQVTQVSNKLEFQLKADKRCMLKPFMDYKEGELYYMYLDR